MSRTAANLMLILAAAIWGGAFVVQKLGAEHLGPMTFTGIRFLIGAAVVAPLALRAWPSVRLDGTAWLGMAAIGIALFAGAVLQQIGLTYTTATNAGFLTTLYVPLVPILVFLAIRDVPHPVVWPAAAGSVVGTWLLSGGGAVEIATGDLWVIASALFWAVQVALIGVVSARAGSATLVAFMQFVMCGLFSTAWGLATEPTTMADLANASWAIAYTGVLSVGMAFTMQAVGQRYTTAADAAVILSAEAVFAALAGALTLGETLSMQQAVGCALIMSCILAVQILPPLLQPKAG